MSDATLDIIGMWEAPPPLSFRILLSADGSGSFNGVAGSWQFDEGVLTIGNESRIHQFAAVVAEDVLTLTADFMPHPFQLQRVSPEQAEAASIPATSEATATPLVGRWRGTQGIAVFRADGFAEISGTGSPIRRTRVPSPFKPSRARSGSCFPLSAPDSRSEWVARRRS